MDKSKIVEIVLKVVIYACTLALAALGVSAMCSCSASRTVESNGRAVIVTNDTTIVNHNGSIYFKTIK